MLDLIKKLNRKDWRLIIIVSLIVIAISFIGVINFLFNTPYGMVYNWRNIYAPADSYVYYGFIKQAKDGAILFRDLYQYNSEPIIFNWFWLLLGNIAKIFNFSSIFVYHLFKIILIPFSIFCFYLFLFYLFKNETKRRLAFLIGVFATGLGAFLFIFQPTIVPMDSTVEGAIFPSFLASPHLTLTLPLFLLIIINTLLFLDYDKLKNAFYAGFFGLLLFQFHPFPLITFVALYLTYFLYLFFTKSNKRWRFFLFSLIFFLISSPSIFYHLVMFFYNPWWRIQSLKTPILTPNILFILISFAPFIYFIFLSLRKKIALKNQDFLGLWLIINLMVAYLPIGFQRRLFIGFFPVLLVFAVEAIYNFIKSKKNKLYIFSIFFILFFYTSTLLISARIISAFDVVNFYLEPQAFKVLNWIKNNINHDKIFISDYNLANIAAGATTLRTYVGHYGETIDYKKKLEEKNSFFKEMSQEERKKFLKLKGIDIVLFYDGWINQGVFNIKLDQNFIELYKDGKYGVYKLK